MGGKPTVVVRDVYDVASMWRNTSSLSFDPFIRGVFKAFGLPSAFVRTVFTEDPAAIIPDRSKPQSYLVNENPARKCYVHLQSDWLRTQLLSKERLESLKNRYYSFLTVQLRWDNISDRATDIRKGNARVKTISLANFSRDIISECSMKTFLGEQILHLSPSFIVDYQKYEYDSWKIFYHFPHFLARDLHHAKQTVIHSVEKYLTLPNEKRDMTWIFRTMDRELAFLNLESKDRAGIIVLILWAYVLRP